MESSVIGVRVDVHAFPRVELPGPRDDALEVAASDGNEALGFVALDAGVDSSRVADDRLEPALDDIELADPRALAEPPTRWPVSPGVARRRRHQPKDGGG